ncbi:hypothetical protein ACFL34_02105 [Candidatus Sumerlaeota bacterium]
MKWEYRSDIFEKRYWNEREEAKMMADHCNAAGQEGWELCAYNQSKVSFFRKRILVFKRPISPESQRPNAE